MIVAAAKKTKKAEKVNSVRNDIRVRDVTKPHQQGKNVGRDERTYYAFLIMNGQPVCRSEYVVNIPKTRR